MELRIAQRKKAKIKLGLQGPAGSGKTYSALLLAKGLCNDWSKIAVIDTENGSADLYSHLGDYNVLTLKNPFTPEKFSEAIEKCLLCGMQVIIIDSISPAWECILDIHNNLPGNSFQNWGKLKPRHADFISTILQASAHVICTIRSKQEYTMVEKNGKNVPEKVGMKGITTENVDYELTLLFEIDIKHNATCSKDRTQLFADKPQFVITEETGRKISSWCENSTRLSDIESRIQDIHDIPSLKQLFENHPEHQQRLKQPFIQQRDKILSENQKRNTNLNISQNGTYNH